MNVEAGTRARRRNREHPNRGGLQRQSLRRPHRPSQTGVGRRRAHTDSHPPRTDPPGSNRSLLSSGYSPRVSGSGTRKRPL